MLTGHANGKVIRKEATQVTITMTQRYLAYDGKNSIRAVIGTSVDAN